jgi:hypothetical protein
MDPLQLRSEMRKQFTIERALEIYKLILSTINLAASNMTRDIIDCDGKIVTNFKSKISAFIDSLRATASSHSAICFRVKFYRRGKSFLVFIFCFRFGNEMIE